MIQPPRRSYCFLFVVALLAGRVSADIMVVLDVSRSMLADDAAPTRLDRAKAEISEMASRLRGVIYERAA